MSIGTSEAAGPPRPSEYGAKGGLSGVGLVCPATTEGAERERLNILTNIANANSNVRKLNSND